VLFLVQVKAEAESCSAILVPIKKCLLLYKYECKPLVVGDEVTDGIDDHNGYHDKNNYSN
jgi:hypothetical protein